MKDDGDITILADYTQAGGWNVLPDFAPTDAAQLTAEIAELKTKLAAAQAKIAALDEQQKNEYICKCGLRVTPHRCKTGEEF